ncbi:hypothetical protein ACJJTC_017480 [Scirpophaga incertulas]
MRSPVASRQVHSKSVQANYHGQDNLSLGFGYFDYMQCLGFEMAVLVRNIAVADGQRTVAPVADNYRYRRRFASLADGSGAAPAPAPPVTLGQCGGKHAMFYCHQYCHKNTVLVDFFTVKSNGVANPL